MARTVDCGQTSTTLIYLQGKYLPDHIENIVKRISNTEDLKKTKKDT